MPVYREVARHSYVGQGSIAMLENRLTGWKHKLFVLALLGFATTDFVITMTLSAADAAEHACENPYLSHALEGHQLGVTLGLLAVLAGVFLRGFREAIGVAMFVGIPYIVLNAVVIVRGFVEIAHRPEVLGRWTEALHAHGDPASLAIAAVLVFPRLALGLSGFETGVAVMPLVDGGPPRSDGEKEKPEGRIAGTGKLLTGAALIMSVLLLSSSLVAAVLVPETAYRRGGEASGRALAWLAHGLLGKGFGTLYDALHDRDPLVRRRVRDGGHPEPDPTLSAALRDGARVGRARASARRPRVRIRRRHHPRLQGGRERAGRSLRDRRSRPDALGRHGRDARAVARGEGSRPVFPSRVVHFRLRPGEERPRPAGRRDHRLVLRHLRRPDERPVPRSRRGTELRVESLVFADDESKVLFDSIRGEEGRPRPDQAHGESGPVGKAPEVKERHRIEGPFAFLHVTLRDDRSEFEAKLEIQVRRIVETGNYFLHVTGAVAVANTIAFISEQIDPRTLDPRPDAHETR